MAASPKQPVKVDSSIRSAGLVIGGLCLILVAMANWGPFYATCFGPCGCVSAEPPTNPHELFSCPTWEQLLPVLRLIEAFPLATTGLFAGSVLLAGLGLYMERLARRTLQGHSAPEWAVWSHGRVTLMANVAQALQLLPLLMVTGAGFVALFTFPVP
jgi:hypothetical protein